jgi:hypothetical protein
LWPARYPGLGLVAGALAGSGSLLAAVLAFNGVGPVSRLLMVTVEMIGLLPEDVLRPLDDKMFSDSGVMLEARTIRRNCLFSNVPGRLGPRA